MFAVAFCLAALTSADAFAKDRAVRKEIASWPNFWEGIWQATAGTAHSPPVEADLRPEIAQIIAASRSGRYADPASQSPALKEALRVGAELAAGGLSCGGLTGMPMLMSLGWGPIKLLPSQDVIAIYIEMGSATRLLQMEGRIHVHTAPTWLGTSSAHWDGSTLVVDTRNLHSAVVPIQKMPFDSGGVSFEKMQKLGPSIWPAGPELRIVERMRLRDRNTLVINTTLYDDTVYLKPYTSELVLHRFTGRLNVPKESFCTD